MPSDTATPQAAGLDPDLLSWYKASDPERNHDRCRASREPASGAWVFDDQGFQKWKSADRGELLWLHGIPGAGKTTLCSTIIDHLQSYIATKQSASDAASISSNASWQDVGPCDQLSYFYFDFSDRGKQNLAALLKCIVFQLISDPSRQVDASDAAKELCKSYSGVGTRNEPTISELLEVCLVEAGQTKRTLLVIDALDECSFSERRKFFDECLGKLLESNVNVLVTSRREPDIERALQIVTSHTICLEESRVGPDVRLYVDQSLQRDSALSALDPGLKEEISECISSGARGMFRWAILQLDRIKQMSSPDDIRKELQSMPTTLDQTYERILRTAPAAQQDILQSALRWLAFSARPIRLDELTEAVAIRPETSRFDPGTSRLPDGDKTIVDLCGVLVSITTIDIQNGGNPEWLQKQMWTVYRGQRNYPEYDVTVVSLSHYSVKEYITSSRLRGNSELRQYYMSSRLTNSFVARCCLVYLASFNGGELASRLHFDQWPLLEYSARYWPYHWVLANAEMEGASEVKGDEAGQDDDGEDRALRRIFEHLLLAPEARDAYINWLNACRPDHIGQSHIGDYTLKRSADLVPQPLYWASFIGDTALVRRLVSEKDEDVDAQGGYFESALGAAAYRGHIDVVEQLLAAGVDPNTQGPKFGSVLHVAAAGGHADVVRRLLDHGADANSRTGSEWETPLMAAAANQSHAVVPLLLDRGADINIIMRGHFRDKGSALYKAAVAGDVKLARVLIAAGADVNGSSPDGNHLPPLYAATEHGSLPMVQLLLDKGADLNTPAADEYYRYPLLAAASWRAGTSFAILRTLLEAGADPNVKGGNGQTVLHDIIRRGDMTAFNVFLDAAEKSDGDAWRKGCFAAAVQNHKFDMARILMDRGAHLGSDSVVAAVRCYVREPWVLETIMVQPGIDADHPGSDEHSSLKTPPLHAAIAAIEGDYPEDVDRDEEGLAAKYLLQWGPYVNSIDPSHYTTPLCRALKQGSTAIAKLLIEEWGADIRQCVNYSPFEMAVYHACEDGGTLEMAELLLDRGVDINENTEYAPYWACYLKKPEILRWLVEKGTDINRVMGLKDRPSGGVSYGNSRISRCTPIQYAANSGDIEMMQLVLSLGADINGPAGNKGTTLHYGLLSKSKKTVDFLLEQGAVVDDTTVADQSTLCKAITTGRKRLIPVLVDKGADVNATEDGKSPLGTAFAAGKRELVDYLLERGARFAADDSQEAVAALEKGNMEDVKFYLEHGLDPDAEHWGASLVRTAMDMANCSAISALVETGVQIKGAKNQQALNHACECGNMDMVRYILDHGTDFDVSDALAHAANTPNNLAMVEILLERGADVAANAAKCFSSAVGCKKTLARLLQVPMTPTERAHYLGEALLAASSSDNMAFCTWLLDEQGANVNYLGLPYGSPLQAALNPSIIMNSRNSNTIHVVEMLLDRGASVNPPLVRKPVMRNPSAFHRHFVRTRDMQLDDGTIAASPLSLALQGSSKGGDTLAATLLARGAHPDGVPGEFKPPLQVAAACQPALVPALLDAGADVRLVGGNGATALHAAAGARNLETARLLLDRGADARAVSERTGSVLAAAVLQSYAPSSKDTFASPVPMMDLLYEAGADPNAQGGEYGSAVQAAAVGGCVEGLKWLAAHGADIKVKGGKYGNARDAARSNWDTNMAVEWEAVNWLEQWYGMYHWD